MISDGGPQPASSEGRELAEEPGALALDVGERYPVGERMLTLTPALAEAAGRARQARQEHTWLSRARTVAQDMQAVRAGALAQARTLRAGGNR